MGVDVFEAFTVDGHKRERFFYVVSALGETYHAEGSTPSRALREAVNAWRKQRELLAAQGVDLPRGVSVLVTRADSYSAGNCQMGTEAFVQEHHLKGRWVVSADWLVKSGDYRALNAVKVAAAKFSQWVVA